MERTLVCEAKGRAFESPRSHPKKHGHSGGRMRRGRSLLRTQGGGQPLGFETSAFRSVSVIEESEPRRPGACLEGKAALQGTGVRLLRSPLGSQHSARSPRRDDPLRQHCKDAICSRGPAATALLLQRSISRRRFESCREHDLTRQNGRQAPGGSGGIFAKDCAL